MYFTLQCRTLLPPKDVDTGCLIELYFTGDRKLSLCAHDLDSAEYVVCVCVCTCVRACVCECSLHSSSLKHAL